LELDFVADFEGVASLLFIVVNNEALGEAYPLHHSKFKVDEKALIYGVQYFEELANRFCH